jgi:hypothetical protein
MLSAWSPFSTSQLILSQMMCQFLPDVKAFLAEQWRVLHANGHFLHLIDFRDHVFSHPFEMLTFPEPIWNWLCPLRDGRGWHNRLRPDDYLKLAREAGFLDVTLRPLGEDREAFEKVRARIRPEFLNKNPEFEAVTLGVWTGRKP